MLPFKILSQTLLIEHVNCIIQLPIAPGINAKRFLLQMKLTTQILCWPGQNGVRMLNMPEQSGGTKAKKKKAKQHTKS